MDERRVEARSSSRRGLALTVAPPKKKVAPTCVAPRCAAAPPATQTRAREGFRDAGVEGKNSSSSQDVMCKSSKAAAAATAPASPSAMSRASSPGFTRRTGPAASFKKTVFITDWETSSRLAVAGAADACMPKPSTATNAKQNSGSAAGHINGIRTSPSPNEGRKRVSSVVFEEPWRPAFQKKPKHEPFSPRRAVQERLSMFRELAVELQRGKETKPDMKALKILKQRGRVPTRRYLGEVPGVEVGDEFHYRSELMVAGLHGYPIFGIDSMPLNGRKVATCVISSKRYVNVMEGNDVLVYCGEGGNPGCCDNGRKEPAGDQRLERGNLALKDSMDAQTPVRVVHGFAVPRDGGEPLESRAKTVAKYVYDGLYRVEDFWWETGRMGFRMLKFRMRRMPGQPKLELKQVWRSREAGKRHDQRTKV